MRALGVNFLAAIKKTLVDTFLAVRRSLSADRTTLFKSLSKAPGAHFPWGMELSSDSIPQMSGGLLALLWGGRWGGGDR